MLHKTLLILALAGTPLCSIAQKAYETSTYSCKIKGHSVTFKLANGYIGASEIDLTMIPKKSPLIYRPDSASPDHSDNQIIFRNEKASAGYFIIKNMQEAYEQVPIILNGVFVQNNKSTRIKLLLSINKI